jgi:hypothetical protein
VTVNAQAASTEPKTWKAVIASTNTAEP